jgi:hypothetical protein
MKIRLNEAIAYAKLNGKTVVKKDLAARLFPESTTECQQVKLTNLVRGRTQRVAPEWVDIICEETGVTPNFLFGYEQ